MKMLQIEAEIDWFIQLLRLNNVTRYLEIGSKFGGSLWRIANALPRGSRVVAVDLPNGTQAWKESSVSLSDCIKELNRLGFDAHMVLGDSTSDAVIATVGELGPFDAVFIDGDHRLPGVTADWKNYGPMGRIVAFHDVAWSRPPEWNGGYRIDVPEFWQLTKMGYRHEEARLDKTGKDNGIGVLWR